MTAMNVAHVRVKPGKVEEFVRLYRNIDVKAVPGARNLWLVRSGERSFIVVVEWSSLEALAAARSIRIAILDSVRPILEDLGGGRGVVEPWSGEVSLHLAA